MTEAGSEVRRQAAPTEGGRVLVLEDEHAAALEAVAVVESAGFPCEHVQTVPETIMRLRSGAFRIVILDRLLGEGSDGLSLLAWMRAWELPMGVLVLSHLGSTTQRIEGLTAGADDYLVKPFEPAELAARLHAVARRIGLREKLPGVHVLGDLTLREAARTANWQGSSIALSDRLFTLLWLLAERPGTVVTREAIWSTVWPDLSGLSPQKTSVEAAISRLRALLSEATGREWIETVRGRGYRFVAE